MTSKLALLSETFSAAILQLENASLYLQDALTALQKSSRQAQVRSPLARQATRFQSTRANAEYTCAAIVFSFEQSTWLR